CLFRERGGRRGTLLQRAHAPPRDQRGRRRRRAQRQLLDQPRSARARRRRLPAEVHAATQRALQCGLHTLARRDFVMEGGALERLVVELSELVRGRFYGKYRGTVT